MFKIEFYGPLNKPADTTAPTIAEALGIAWLALRTHQPEYPAARPIHVVIRTPRDGVYGTFHTHLEAEFTRDFDEGVSAAFREGEFDGMADTPASHDLATGKKGFGRTRCRFSVPRRVNAWKAGYDSIMAVV